MQREGDQDAIPFQPGSPMYKFFQQFGSQGPAAGPAAAP